MRDTSRAVWQDIMAYKKPARMPLFEIEGIPAETVDRWRGEGLPPGADVNEYLGIDTIEWIHTDYYPMPHFARKAIEENDEYRIEVNYQGITTQVSKSHPELVYQFLEYPVKNRADWERLLERYDPNDIRRLPLDWGDPELPDYYNSCTDPVGMIVHPFFFRLGLYSIGLVRFLEWFYDEPELLHEIFSFWADFTITLTKKITKEITPDFVVIAEDMAYKTAPHISPEMYRDFWYPHQSGVIESFKNAGIKVISFWNSGNIMPLIPKLIDSGFNCMWPLEDVAGMKARKVREQYGNEMRMVGNIAKEALISGRDAIKHEVYEKVPPMIEAGGYIPAVDDQTPLEVSFDNYRYYLDQLRQVGGEMGI